MAWGERLIDWSIHWACYWLVVRLFDWLIVWLIDRLLDRIHLSSFSKGKLFLLCKHHPSQNAVPEYLRLCQVNDIQRQQYARYLSFHQQPPPMKEKWYPYIRIVPVSIAVIHCVSPFIVFIAEGFLSFFGSSIFSSGQKSKKMMCAQRCTEKWN